MGIDVAELVDLAPITGLSIASLWICIRLLQKFVRDYVKDLHDALDRSIAREIALEVKIELKNKELDIVHSKMNLMDVELQHAKFVIESKAFGDNDE